MVILAREPSRARHNIMTVPISFSSANEEISDRLHYVISFFRMTWILVCDPSIARINISLGDISRVESATVTARAIG